MPKVSVIMPMYNSEKYVKQAVESILNQTFKDLELIAINDGSKDKCGEIVSQIKDDRLVFIDRENKGFINTLNECLGLARGEYIARLDDDDWCYPTRLEKQVEFLDNNPNVVLVGTQTDEQIEGEIIASKEAIVTTPEQIRYSLIFNNYAFSHSSFMMRKKTIVENNVKYEIFKQVPDYHMITELSKYGDIARIPESLTVYRIHDMQSTQVRSEQMKQEEADRARAMFIDSLNLPSDDKLAIKKGILRKLSTKQDIKSFNIAIKKYAEQCNVANKDNKDCRDYLYAQNMIYQYCTPKLLMACMGNGYYSWLFSKKGMIFIGKCLLNRNKYYIETEVGI